VSRAILHNDTEAEDVMQDAYVRAYTNLSQYAGRAPFSTWLTRIAVNEALARRRSHMNHQQVDVTDFDGEFAMKDTSQYSDPERTATDAQLRGFLEQAVLDLPQQYRAVVMLRDIEELSTSETAHVLDLTEENVKVRLHRGHRMIRNWLFDRIGARAKEAFSFLGVRCDHVVQNVLDRLNDTPA